MTWIGCKLSLQGRQLLGLVFYKTLSVLMRVAQQWHTLWSRCLSSFDVRCHLSFVRRHMPDESFQSVTAQAKTCLVKQDRSPPESRRVVICPDGDLNCGRSATHSRFATELNAERERGQRCDHRHPTTVEDGVHLVVA